MTKMTKDEALKEFARWSLDGFEDWESTPLFSVWDDGDFPVDSDTISYGEDDFEAALILLKSNYPPSSDISKLPTWCQVYLLLTKEG